MAMKHLYYRRVECFGFVSSCVCWCLLYNLQNHPLFIWNDCPQLAFMFVRCVETTRQLCTPMISRVQCFNVYQFLPCVFLIYMLFFSWLSCILVCLFCPFFLWVKYLCCFHYILRYPQYIVVLSLFFAAQIPFSVGDILGSSRQDHYLWWWQPHVGLFYPHFRHRTTL